MIEYPIAVFVDTNIFDSCKYNISENSLLKSLENFVNQDKVKLFISNIVKREADKHIVDSVTEVHRAFKKASREAKKAIAPSILTKSPIIFHLEIPEIEEMKNVALTEFQNYLEGINTIILDNAGVEVEQILDDYFNGKLPFEISEKKKNEFPDAIMISKLKKEFSAESPIWIISNDKGFRDSFEQLDGFNTIVSLRELFDMINRNDEKVSNIYNNIKLYFQDYGAVHIASQSIISKLLDEESIVDGRDYDRKGYSEGYEYDYSYLETVDDFSFSLSTIDEINTNYIIVTARCEAVISAYCTYEDYDNSVWDSEDKEYLFLEEVAVKEIHRPVFYCTLTYSINQEHGQIRYELSNLTYNLKLDEDTREYREMLDVEDPTYEFDNSELDEEFNLKRTLSRM